jgi:hypothetical protein
MSPFFGPDTFLQSLRTAQLVHGRHPLRYFAKSARVVFAEKSGLPMPAGYGRNCSVIRVKHGRQAKALTHR